ncbi:resolvase [Aquipluma nitroreducens]|uniref:Resolvase n=1 Tax=Aquipluma nitroreducens TaxID=2010828 RepID=A0A5K7S7D0_9BACT|nr:recombinase family protein [Aquipluma nitroreducens]BBE17481.1 resolvase [Aquipluma nitroreducens]
MQQVVLFGRVSSTNERQSFERQINDLTQLATKLNYRVVSVFAEKISGATKNAARKELLNMIEFVNSNQIDKVLVTELSRLGRDTLQVLQTIEILNQNKISLYIQNYNIETLTPEKQINPMSQFLITILAEVARMERKTIENRLASGYMNFRNAGGGVGRKAGFRKSNEAMKDQYTEEIKMLKKGYSFTHINQITQTNKNTLTKLKKLFID